MAAHAFWAVFSSSRQRSQISPTAENEVATIPPPKFFFLLLRTKSLLKNLQILDCHLVHMLIRHIKRSIQL